MATPKNGNGKPASKRSSKSKLRYATEAFEEALKDKTLKRARYILRLYVTGSSHRSLRAVYNLKKLCEEYLPDDYDLEVIDIYKDPEAAREEQIIAAPTLVKKLPRPLRKFVGDMSNTQKILVGLDLYERKENGKRLRSATS
ncbi:MAG TPA: circadian clock KaiB family protein [Pyrinomonadaceae bacterium]|nr:circadian clock KaiB family protein [Pyrinomonadaceae bacterium]